VSLTNTGPFMGVPPTDVHHIYIFTFREGKIVEYQAVMDDIS
jgi:hypothetical protein